MIQICVIKYFDPFGDMKSVRRVFRREYYRVEESFDVIKNLNILNNINRGYYDTISVCISKGNKGAIIDSSMLTRIV